MTVVLGDWPGGTTTLGSSHTNFVDLVHFFTLSAPCSSRYAFVLAKVVGTPSRGAGEHLVQLSQQAMTQPQPMGSVPNRSPMSCMCFVDHLAATGGANGGQKMHGRLPQKMMMAATKSLDGGHATQDGSHFASPRYPRFR